MQFALISTKVKDVKYSVTSVCESSSHSSFWAGDKVDSKHIVLSNKQYCQHGYAWISLDCKNYCPASYNYLSNLFNWYPKCLKNISVEAVWSAIEKQFAIVLKEGNTTNDISYKQYS